MWKKIRPLLIPLSVALNVAFVTFWAVHALPSYFGGRHRTTGDGAVWCSLHRKLGVTDAQWREIEPRLIEFQKSVRGICAEVSRARGEMLDLIAAPEAGREAIRAKQEEIFAGQRRMQKLVISHLLSEKKALTQEQQRQLFEMLRRRSGCAGHGPMMGRTGLGPVGPAEAAGESETAR